MLIFPTRLVWYKFGHQMTSISRVARPSPYPTIRLLMHVILALGIAPWAFLLAARRACTGSASPCFSCSATSTCPFHDALSFKVKMFCLAKACSITPRSKKRYTTFLVEEHKMGARQWCWLLTEWGWGFLRSLRNCWKYFVGTMLYSKVCQFPVKGNEPDWVYIGKSTDTHNL